MKFTMAMNSKARMASIENATPVEAFELYFDCLGQMSRSERISLSHQIRWLNKKWAYFSEENRQAWNCAVEANQARLLNTNLKVTQIGI